MIKLQHQHFEMQVKRVKPVGNLTTLFRVDFFLVTVAHVLCRVAGLQTFVIICASIRALSFSVDTRVLHTQVVYRILWQNESSVHVTALLDVVKSSLPVRSVK